MMTIALHGAEFFAWHGFYPEEQKLGTKFIVDVEVDFRPVTAGIRQDDITHTVDYEQLYEIVCEEMKITRKLIETVAQSIADGIKAKYAFADRIMVKLKKVHPPMGGNIDHSSVTIIV
jgi:dihydroneopterin aldolase